MKPFPTKELTYFIGKVCSVFTTTSSRDLKLEDIRNYPASLHRYFLGVVESIDEYGIFLTQVTKGLKVFIMKDQLIAIAEEEVLDPDNPQDSEDIKQFIEQKKIMDELEQNNNQELKTPYLDTEAIKKIAEDLNKNFGEPKP
jgi:hypothetical protein